MSRLSRCLALGSLCLLLGLSATGCTLSKVVSEADTATEFAFGLGFLTGGAATGVATAPLSLPIALALSSEPGLFHGAWADLWVCFPGSIVGYPLGVAVAAPVAIVEYLFVRPAHFAWNRYGPGTKEEVEPPASDAPESPADLVSEPRK